ncbi:mitochondrial genome maintenance exonuclease 1-like [Mercenaria mercenaria]|uniref:mitochondrial genome maintenance exonuclease 1-like n=1 Tax=Mercenaria mercenaria TaxID=6596 RepID=UPI00234EAA28|nr:mitochondrial genome maintenance exonuclease 1-like [Mercenaria mercenaria]
MSCLRSSLYHAIRRVVVKPDIDITYQLLHMNSLSIFGLRTCSTKTFDLNQIARSNRENSSLDGVKRSITQKARKSKTNASKDEVSVEPEERVDVPHWLGTVMDCPLYSNSKIDVSKQAQFKDFVEELDMSYLPSVSTIINRTESESQKKVLKRWKAAKTKELGGEKQFKEYQQGIIDNGLNLHKCIELTLKGEEGLNIKESNKGHWESVQTALGDVQKVKSLEYDCVHPEMFYRGKFDCIAEFRDTLCLIEWKTSSSHKPLLSATYDNPLQVAAYIGAVNRSGILKQLDIPDLTNGALVFAYPTGEPATVHMMSQKVCERYWRKWLDRLYIYWVLQFQHSQRNEVNMV